MKLLQRFPNIPSVGQIAFVALVSCILLAPAGNIAESLLTGKEPRSELEGRKRRKLVPVTWKTAATGKAQSVFDSWLVFSIPQRDNALLLHAKWQRKLIRLASRLFSFDVYPTFYGSKFAYIHGMKHIVAIPGKATRQRKKSFKSLAERYAVAMRAYPNVRWFFAYADMPNISSAGPFRHLINNPYSYDTRRKYFLKHLPAFCNVIDLGYSKGEAIYGDYFKTDHHWRIQGAIRAYSKIAYALGMNPIKFGAAVPVTNETFFGSYSRQSLKADVRADAIWDAPYARSALAVKVNGKPVPESFLNYGYSREPYKEKSKFSNQHSDYFHGQTAEIHIVNKNIAKGSLLIIGDSYTHSMERFFAENYRDVYKIEPRRTKDTLGNFLRHHAVDDVLILLSLDEAMHKKILAFLR